MTLRLVLVGLVAALGLTIPKWSDEKNRAESAQPVRVGRINNQGVKKFPRTVRSEFNNRRIPQSPTVAGNKKFQPAGFGSGVVRPSTKTAANFWQIPTGPRPVRSNAPVVATLPIIKGIRRYSEPIQLAEQLDTGLSFTLNRQSEGISAELQGPPARLKVAKRDSRPARPLDAGMDVYQAIEKFVENAHKPQVTGEMVVLMVGHFKSNVESLAIQLSHQVNQTGQMVWNSTKSIHAALLVKKASKPTVAVAAVEPLKAELAALPDDVFAVETLDQIAALPDSVFVVETRDELAALPEDVFASEMIHEPIAVVAQRSEPAHLVELPNDVFAPEIQTQPTVGVASKAPENPGRTEIAGAKSTADSSRTNSIAGTAPEKSRAVGGSDHLTKAVSLTRDAAFAWMKLLSGPAVVTLTR